MTLEYSTFRAQGNRPENHAFERRSRGERHRDDDVPSSYIPENVRKAIVHLDHGLEAIKRLKAQILKPGLRISDEVLNQVQETLVDTWQKWAAAIEESNHFESFDAKREQNSEMQKLIDFQSQLNMVNALIDDLKKKTGEDVVTREDDQEMLRLNEKKSLLEMELRNVFLRQARLYKSSDGNFPDSEPPTKMDTELRALVFDALSDHERRSHLDEARLRDLLGVSQLVFRIFSADEVQNNPELAEILKRLNGIHEMARGEPHSLISEVSNTKQAIVRDLQEIVMTDVGSEEEKERVEQLTVELVDTDKVSASAVDTLVTETENLIQNLSKVAPGSSSEEVSHKALLPVKIKLATFETKITYFRQYYMKVEKFCADARGDKEDNWPEIVSEGELALKGLNKSADNVWKMGTDILQDLQHLSEIIPDLTEQQIFRKQTEMRVRDQVEEMIRQLRKRLVMCMRLVQNTESSTLTDALKESAMSRNIDQCLITVQHMEANFSTVFPGRSGVVARLRTLLSHPPLYKAWVRESLAEICTGTCTL